MLLTFPALFSRNPRSHAIEMLKIDDVLNAWAVV